MPVIPIFLTVTAEASPAKAAALSREAPAVMPRENAEREVSPAPQISSSPVSFFAPILYLLLPSVIKEPLSPRVQKTFALLRTASFSAASRNSFSDAFIKPSSP